MKIIITENQVDKIKSKIHEYVKKYGFEKCREIFGDKVLLTIGFNNDPMEFLNLFNDLDVVQSKFKDIINFLHDDNYLLVYDSGDNKILYVVDDSVWNVLKFDFGVENLKELIKFWFEDVYNYNVKYVTLPT